MKSFTKLHPTLLVVLIIIVIFGVVFWALESNMPQDALPVEQIVVTQSPVASVSTKPSPVVSNKPISTPLPPVPTPLAASPAKTFLENLMKDLKITNSSLVAATKKVYFGTSYGVINRTLDGVTLPNVSGATSLNQYFFSKGFKEDAYNSGDATFNGSTGYLSNNLVCVAQYHTKAPNNDYSKCGPAGVCTSTTDVFCTGVPQF